jgi:hypothetical protein
MVMALIYFLLDRGAAGGVVHSPLRAILRQVHRPRRYIQLHVLACAIRSSPRERSLRKQCRFLSPRLTSALAIKVVEGVGRDHNRRNGAFTPLWHVGKSLHYRRVPENCKTQGGQCCQDHHKRRNGAFDGGQRNVCHDCGCVAVLCRRSVGSVMLLSFLLQIGPLQTEAGPR